MAKGGDAPAAPDYAKLIPLQTAANKDVFNYALGSSRVNNVGPYGTQTWSQTPTFDQGGYDRAMADWQAGNRQGTWVPGGSQAPSAGMGYWNAEGMGGAADTPGHWDGASSDGSRAPTRDQFTSNQWTQTTQLSPEQQRLYDANIGSQLKQSSLLDALTQRANKQMGQEPDYSGAPGLRGEVSPTSSGEVFRGSVTPSGSGLSRAQGLAQQLAGYSGKLAALDPAQFDRTAADALYSQATRYLDPQKQQDQRALEARLAEQGFVPGTPAYAQAMATFQDTNNRAYADARDRALTLGSQVGHTQFGDASGNLQAQIAAALSGAQFGQGADAQDFGQRLSSAGFERQHALDANQVAQQLFDQNLRGATFQNQSRQQSIAEMLARRMLPFNEMNAVRTGSQIQMPTGQTQYSVPPLQAPDQLGAAQLGYQNAMQGYNAGVSSDNALMGGLFQLGGAALGAPSGGGLSQLLALLGGGR